MFLNEALIILGRLFLVHLIEVEAGIVAFYGLDQRSESILEATLTQESANQTM